MSGDFTPQQKRYLEGFVAGVEARGSNGVLASAAFAPTAPKLKPISPDAPHLLAQDAAIKRGKKACGPGKLEAGRAYLRCLSFSRPSRARRKSKAHRQFPLAVLRSLLCRSGARQLYVPIAHSERHSLPLAIRFGVAGLAHMRTLANLQFRARRLVQAHCRRHHRAPGLGARDEAPLPSSAKPPRSLTRWSRGRPRQPHQSAAQGMCSTVMRPRPAV
jgi:hypothetical protein